MGVGSAELVVALSIASTLTLYWIGQGALDVFGTVSDLLVDLAAFSAAVAWLWGTIRLEASRIRAVFTAFTLGLCLWFGAELAWSVYLLVLHMEVPYPSFADVLWLAGYVPLALGFVMLSKWLGLGAGRKTLVVQLTVASASAAAVAAITALPMLSFALAGEASVPALYFDSAYAVLDLVLLFLAVLGIGLAAQGGLSLGVAWLPAFLAIVLNAVADQSFSYLSAYELYHAGSIVDALFTVSYVLLAYGAYRVWETLPSMSELLRQRGVSGPLALDDSSLFSRAIGVPASQLFSRKILFEFDPASSFDKHVRAFAGESLLRDIPTIFFTRSGSVLHESIQDLRGLSFVLLTATLRTPTRSGEVLLLPTADTALILDTVVRASSACEKSGLALVFDNLSDLVKSLGFRKAYMFTKLTLEVLVEKPVSALFMINPSSHESRISASFRALFANQVSCGAQGLKVARWGSTPNP